MPPEVPLTPAEARTLQGAGARRRGHRLGAVPARRAGVTGAKTGTAEYGEPDAAGTLPTHAWMIAIRGDLAVAVFVETGVSGSQTAGPVLEAFLR